MTLDNQVSNNADTLSYVADSARAYVKARREYIHHNNTCAECQDGRKPCEPSDDLWLTELDLFSALTHAIEELDKDQARCPYCKSPIPDDCTTKDGQALCCPDCNEEVEFIDATDIKRVKPQANRLRQAILPHKSNLASR